MSVSDLYLLELKLLEKIIKRYNKRVYHSIFKDIEEVIDSLNKKIDKDNLV